MSSSIPREVALAVLSSLLSLVLLELVLAAFDVSLYPPPLYPGDVEAERDETTDPLIGWKLPPSTVLTETTVDYSVSYSSNSSGFRASRELDAVSGLEPIVFLGDSYTFGSGVEDDETFVYLLERRLDGIACLNLGIGGFGIDQMWMTLRHYALPLEPRAVVLTFVRPDLDRSLSAYRRGHVWREKPTFRLERGTLVPLTAANRPSRARRFLAQRSALASLWRKTESSLAQHFPIGYRWKLNRALFESIRDDCHRANVPLLAVYIPINRRNPAPVYKGQFAEMRVPFLDLTDRLPSDADSLYYPNDHHLNPAGHRWVAEELHAFLHYGDEVRLSSGAGVGSAPWRRSSQAAMRSDQPPALSRRLISE